MNTDTERRSALVTGAARGLGRELAFEAARRGFDLYLVDISESVLEVARQVNGQGMVGDLSDPEFLKALTDWAENIDVLINNAGISSSAPFHRMSQVDVSRTVLVNVMAPTMLGRVYLKRFIDRGRGELVNVSSSAAYFPTPGLAPYGASKAFINSFSEALIEEYRGNSGINVIAVCPSGIRTNFQQASGVRNKRPDRLLNPKVLARQVFDLVDSHSSGVKDLGWPTLALKAMGRVLPRFVFRRIVGYLMKQYR